jgi:arsenate reductase
MKNVLVLCTGNSCRSIIAEAILNAELGEQLKCYSSGVAASGQLHPLSLRILQEIGLSTQGLYSKRIEELPKVRFDLVVTVCDHARETCPIFPGSANKIHVGIEDPVSKGMEGFEETVQAVTDRLLPAVLEALELPAKAEKLK